MNPGSARRIQQALHDQGYLREAPSGRLDAPTSAALREFQRRHDLAETGAPDRETLRRLGIDPSGVYVTGDGGS
jgi:peptidoglycan hydrolase-like protein with peptidoglycan-binding domain